MHKLNDVANIVSKLRILRAAQISELLGISSTTLWRWRQDPTNDFPQPIALGPRLVGWRVSDIESYLDKNIIGSIAA
ncbi:MAG: AlpA family phage regulatory protein [Shewanella psychromarinicola]|uniref:helix-turn-helix transcriptional regulator n=1 Tax=Shewanella psychromarinicola TaxID=2487742 RepID=UPI003003534F